MSDVLKNWIIVAVISLVAVILSVAIISSSKTDVYQVTEEPNTISEEPTTSEISKVDEGKLKESAKDRANSLLAEAPFSYINLLDVLVADGFNKDIALWAVDNCDVEWEEQAVREAERYLKDGTKYNRDSLITKLLERGFTEDQSKYAANKLGFTKSDE